MVRRSIERLDPTKLSNASRGRKRPGPAPDRAVYNHPSWCARPSTPPCTSPSRPSAATFSASARCGWWRPCSGLPSTSATSHSGSLEPIPSSMPASACTPSPRFSCFFGPIGPRPATFPGSGCSGSRRPCSTSPSSLSCSGGFSSARATIRSPSPWPRRPSWWRRLASPPLRWSRFQFSSPPPSRCRRSWGSASRPTPVSAPPSQPSAR